ncbi:MAG: hypothetical protein KGH49_00650 [Candidatus Micrarchaeota archaeon]|nr:hypothetical protein [Candidatus Micrarchaeota archaeon]
MEGILVSLDIMLALPIAFASMTLILGCYHAYSGQLGQVGVASSQQLGLYDKSQLMAQSLSNLHLDPVQSVSFVKNYSNANRIDSALLPIGYLNGTSCLGLVACRIVEVEGNTYLLVVRNESAG